MSRPFERLDTTNHDIFGEVYIWEYTKLKKQFPYWSADLLMKLARDSTVEFIHEKLKSRLPTYHKIWPKDFAIPEDP